MASCWGCKKMFTIAKEMKVANFIANMMAFNPPTKVNYDLEEDNFSNNNSNSRGACYKPIKFIHKEYSNVYYPWINVDCYQLQKCSSKKRIVLLHIENTFVPKEKKLTLIFSHGNACDLSVVYPFLIDLSTQLKADVISYDYSGYGRSEGSPSEKEIYTDIEQVMDFVTISLGVENENIIL
jgi:pimeloyl-ACP methyl ester carboxylesterase